MYVFIDTDPGLDDFLALSYVFQSNLFEIVAVSSTSGNVDINNSTKNLKLICGIFGKKLNKRITIYQGISKPIIHVENTDAKRYHGIDGLGEFWTSEYVKENEIESCFDHCIISDLPAVQGLIEMSRKYSGELVVMALGPLGNIALAQLIDPEFGSRLKEIFIMGGTITGAGNCDNHFASEFNFSFDPEAAYVVFKEITCRKTVLPLETASPIKMKVYIDCDPGIDDAFALGYLLTRKNFNIVGIGSVSGNVYIDKVNKNLQLIVSALNPDVNIFKGSSNFIIENVGYNAEFYHGSDGIGDFWKSEYFQRNKTKIEKILEMSTFSKKSAVLEMIDLSIKYPQELVIIALGPLTNIALAQLVDPHFGERIKEIFIMGGNYRGPGNSNVYTESEFNFSMDPEAVQIVLNRIQCPKHIYPIDASGTPIIKREYFDKWKENKVFKEIIEILINYVFESSDENHFYDLVLAIIFAHPEVIRKEIKRNVTIDLTGNSSRGHIVIDESSYFTNDKDKKFNFSNKFSSVFLIEELNEEKIIEFIKAF